MKHIWYDNRIKLLNNCAMLFRVPFCKWSALQNRWNTQLRPSELFLFRKYSNVFRRVGLPDLNYMLSCLMRPGRALAPFNDFSKGNKITFHWPIRINQLSISYSIFSFMWVIELSYCMRKHYRCSLQWFSTAVVLVVAW